MNITAQSIIGEVTAKEYRAAIVFKKNGIDFCCNGNRSIAAACKNDEARIHSLITELQRSIETEDVTGINYNSWPLDLLADYIEKKHHRYVTTRIAEIQPLLDKVVKVHGSQHPELIEVEALFHESAGELTAHMKKEELILFPYIRKMVAAGNIQVQAPFGTVQNPIDMMLQEHNNEGERFRKIAALTGNYTAPVDACNTYQVSFALLKEFEEDLHLHIHLENNILFPKAIAMERQPVS